MIVYLRSVQPVKNRMPVSQANFPINLLLQSAPKPITVPVGTPDLSDQIKRGAFLTQMANCAECHTIRTRGQQNTALAFAGGMVMNGHWGSVCVSNITPDPSGISYYDEALFIQAMCTGMVRVRKLKPIMSWDTFKNMIDEDLKAIFAYLRTLKPLHHSIDNTEPPTACKLCGNKHGLGDHN